MQLRYSSSVIGDSVNLGAKKHLLYSDHEIAFQSPSVTKVDDGQWVAIQRVISDEELEQIDNYVVGQVHPGRKLI